MRKIFLADAHLRAPADANYRALIRFLDTLPTDTDTLYLLGDLFEFWVGDQPVYRHYDSIIDCLKRVRQRGVRIVYFEGNHDFHLAGYFGREIGAEVHGTGGVVEIGGKRVFLCHGDQLNPDDTRYRVWRAILHSAAAGLILTLLPARLKADVAARLSRRSSRHHGVRRRKFDYPGLIRSFAAGRFAAGCHAVVTGHFHFPLWERDGERTLLALGDWITQFSYGQWLDGAFTLEKYQVD
ncbi:UDP-2,3-diacylglucosamine diphosphatase [Geomesophilobacter sediminis]|uniref:UDP-2,3-diacylglucosamine diphosphatase n=1 Tax=Geomesophilobacter sediminis TaxID=2798584 RepID=A0A8J7M0Y0_9BACT|nr:UDP-2,3-diacylglucosamine diphosphatase [Geomesophilobacter sediminis]MBJ6726602.1 UDP-2,3-diacylglucosamine diphosphatase [Geomesophilobacter sediminis]